MPNNKRGMLLPGIKICCVIAYTYIIVCNVIIVPNTRQYNINILNNIKRRMYLLTLNNKHNNKAKMLCPDCHIAALYMWHKSALFNN